MLFLFKTKSDNSYSIRFNFKKSLLKTGKEDGNTSILSCKFSA
jgi:hypothetical protein